jgi:hypothetical protein
MILIQSCNSAQTIFSDEDVEICNSKFEYAASEVLYEKSIGDVIVEIGKTSLGVDYEAHTLEQGDEEKLIVHLTGLDCYTFFESSLVFARCIKKGKTTFEDFKDELQNVRYREGIIDGYPSRLHYASDWMFDNARRGIVKDVTKEIGGQLYDKEINFMSEHSDSYKRMKDQPDVITQIERIERDINSRSKYYVPENKIEHVESDIQNGDIVLITADLEGLDISHTGIAVRKENGSIHFMHAPLKGKKVQITSEPLSDYIKNVKRHTGIMIARPLEP